MYFDYRKLIWLRSIFFVLICANATFAVASENTISPKELFNESLTLYNQGKIIEAVAKLEKLEKRDPNNPNVVANLAQFSGEAGLYKKAIKYFEKLKQLEPDNIDAEVGYALYKSISLANEKKYEEAVNVLEGVVNEAPSHQSIIWNLATFSSEINKPKNALKYWLRLAKLEPKNMHLQSKIIQSHQALNDIKNRDQAIEKIIKMYQGNVDPGYIKQNMFCREQYDIGGWKIFVFQYFDPGRKDKYFYRYSVTDHTGYEMFWLSLGSYHGTTMVARETGSIPASARMYHLDYYSKGMHATKGMYTKKPGYDELREVARKIIIKEIERKQNSN